MQMNIKRLAHLLVALFALAGESLATTQTFGTAGNQFSMTFVPINTSYELGDTEVLNEQFNKFYLATKGIAYADNVGRLLTDGAGRVRGIEVVDFINWLNTSSGFPEAYAFNANHNALINWDRASGASYFLATVAEWNAGYATIHYAPGPCTYEWIQDTAGVGSSLDTVSQGNANKYADSSFLSKIFNTGFRVVRVFPPHFDVVATSPQRAGTVFSVSVIFKDANGNTITSDSSTVVTMTSSTGNAQFDSNGNDIYGDNAKTLTNGTFTINTKVNVGENIVFTATGRGLTGTSPVITVLLPPPPEIVVFGIGANQFSLSFNSDLPTFNMGSTEILNDQFNKFYLATKGYTFPANAPLSPTHAACDVSGIELIDFINWLNTSKGYTAAYMFNQAHTALVSWTRAPGAKFFLPTVAEWNGALPYINYAPGPCISEWIQDTGSGGGNLNGVDQGVPGMVWYDGFDNTYPDVGFRVVSDPSVLSPYLNWAAVNAGGQAANLDFDKDGVPNGAEFFLGATGSSFTRGPSVVVVGNNLRVTWPKIGNLIASFTIQTSDNLTDWTDIPSSDPRIATPNLGLVFTTPKDTAKKFFRLVVTP